MSGPPPENLMDWSKPMLVKELARLRTILREHSDHLAETPRSGGDFADVAGDPHARGGVVLDTRDAVLMDANDVILVDRKEGEEPVAMALVIEGRVNLKRDRAKQMYLFGADGAAALVSQLVGLAGRAGGQFGRDFAALLDQRMKELP